MSENFNLMLDVLHSYGSSMSESGAAEFPSATIVSPGFRHTINLGSLQIVPGLAIPISFSSTKDSYNVLAYLSFEHPF